MIERDRTHHLSARRRTGAHSVTISAAQILRCVMLQVAETNAKGGSSFRRSSEPTEFVTSATRGNITSIELCLWCVATKANRVSASPSRNRKRNTTAILSMASRASDPGGRMSSVIEFHIEALQPRKWFHRSGLYVRVTDAANWAS
jgi:hypothetical protein